MVSAAEPGKGTLQIHEGPLGTTAPSQYGAAKNPAMRGEFWLEQVRIEFERRGLLDKCMVAIAEGLQAMTTVRVRADDSARGWNYAIVPDHPVRLSAARLALAYAAGNPPTQADVRLTGGPTDAGARPSARDRLAELHACGIALETIAGILKAEHESLAAVDVTPERKAE